MRYKKSLIHIRLSEQTHHKLKIVCAKRDETIQAFVERAIEQALAQADRSATSFAAAEDSGQLDTVPAVAETRVEYTVAASDQPIATQSHHDSLYLDQGFLIKNRRTTVDRLEHASKSGQ